MSENRDLSNNECWLNQNYWVYCGIRLGLLTTIKQQEDIGVDLKIAFYHVLPLGTAVSRGIIMINQWISSFRCPLGFNHTPRNMSSFCQATCSCSFPCSCPLTYPWGQSHLRTFPVRKSRNSCSATVASQCPNQDYQVQIAPQLLMNQWNSQPRNSKS